VLKGALDEKILRVYTVSPPHHQQVGVCNKEAALIPHKRLNYEIVPRMHIISALSLNQNPMGWCTQTFKIYHRASAGAQSSELFDAIPA
jgi:hypothetical protein